MKIKSKEALEKMQKKIAINIRKLYEEKLAEAR